MHSPGARCAASEPSSVSLCTAQYWRHSCPAAASPPPKDLRVGGQGPPHPAVQRGQQLLVHSLHHRGQVDEQGRAGVGAHAAPPRRRGAGERSRGVRPRRQQRLGRRHRRRLWRRLAVDLGPIAAVLRAICSQARLQAFLVVDWSADVHGAAGGWQRSVDLLKKHARTSRLTAAVQAVREVYRWRRIRLAVARWRR